MRFGEPYTGPLQYVTVSAPADLSIPEALVAGLERYTERSIDEFIAHVKANPVTETREELAAMYWKRL